MKQKKKTSVAYWSPPQSTRRYLQLRPEKVRMSAITACLRIKTTLTSGETCILSYATPEYDNTFLFEYHSEGTIGVYVNGERKIISVPGYQIFDGVWHHWCFTWKRRGGKWALYVDGEKKASGSGFVRYKTMPADGVWLVGQDQDNVGGGFQAEQSFLGHLSSVNVWDHIDVNINAAANCDDTIGGNVIAWNNVTVVNHGVATYDTDLCSDSREWPDQPECDATCAGGNQSRTRECLPVGSVCTGSTVEKRGPCCGFRCQYWTDWMDKDDPSKDGDWEVDETPCAAAAFLSEPIIAECRVVQTQQPWDASGYQYFLPCSVYGVVCRNAENEVNWREGDPPVCPDLEIRYLCRYL
ncbi:neuronal pentraxin-2-like [Lingula anatina]|uniref:Neuronal pentraxin-2-like n=1 Tax=Lingula anatina TaxID=7574 RepID=A0A1S3IU10_LINAN|nr:neuronal pentraxin-2-like [Lingula anatina]|eukprot:XP_013401690.2 neuronal pentraxin-2-like [Lingula anatina]